MGSPDCREQQNLNSVYQQVKRDGRLTLSPSLLRKHIELLIYNWKLKRKRLLSTNKNNDRSRLFLQFQEGRGSNLDLI